MKFSISYNIFDGLELLRDSILQIRDSVDFISIVYQKQSNIGENFDNSNFIKQLKNENLIDEIYYYVPDLKISQHNNEVNKRNIGYYLAIENNCDYHMSMDCDEYYLKKDFNQLIKFYNNNNVDSAFCKMKTYFKENIYTIDPPEEYFVSLFFKTSNNNSFILNCESPVLVDPTRRMISNEYKIFDRDEIEMHHLSYVRDNIKLKLNNSSARQNFKNIDFVIDYYNNWVYPQKALLMGANNKYFDVLENYQLRDEIGKNIL